MDPPPLWHTCNASGTHTSFPHPQHPHTCTHGTHLARPTSTLSIGFPMGWAGLRLSTASMGCLWQEEGCLRQGRPGRS